MTADEVHQSVGAVLAALVIEIMEATKKPVEDGYFESGKLPPGPKGVPAEMLDMTAAAAWVKVCLEEHPLMKGGEKSVQWTLGVLALDREAESLARGEKSDG